MELACALVLLIVGSVTAGPYGYGTKGGAAAKADARAVAGTYAGAGSVPLIIPSGAGYSGSFSQSSSSSAASSSASSSSFSYSGSGAIGGAVLGGNGCGSGKCNAGDATGSQGSATVGSHADSGVNAGSLSGGYGGKIPTGSYGHKYGNDEAQANGGQNCGPEGCQGSSDLHSLSGIGAGIVSQSSSDAKAAASAGAGQTGGSKCGGSNCNNVPGYDNKCVSGQCGSNAKCSSGNCGGASDIGGTPAHYDDSNKCTSGQCGPNQGTDGSSSNDSEMNDINVNTSGSANSKSSYDANKPGCSNGDCGSSPAPGSPKAYGYDKPALELTAPKLEPSCSGIHCQILPSGYSSFSQTKAPSVLTSYQNENQLGHVSSPGYGGYSKPTYAHESSPYSPKPSEKSCAPGTPGCGVTASGYDGSSSGKPSYSHGSTPLVGPSSPVCAPGNPGCISSSSLSVPSDCAPGSPGCKTGLSTSRPVCVSGNCGAYPSGFSSSSLGIKPSYSHGSQPSYSSVNPLSPACTPGSPGCATSSTPTGPLGCTSGNCGGSTSTGYSDSSNNPSYSHGSSSSFSFNPSGLACTPGSPGCPTSTSPSGSSGCALGNCGGSPISTGYSDFSNKPSYSHGGSPSYIISKPSGTGCVPGTPGCVSTPSAIGTSGCASGQCGVNPAAVGYDSSSNIKPSYSHGNSPSYTPGKPAELPCAPGTPGCNIAKPASGPSDCISGNCGAYPSIPGYGGSSGIKPNYSQGGLPSFSTLIPSGSACTPGSPGCSLSPEASGPSGCKSGNCDTRPSSAAAGSLGINPSNSYGSPTAHTQLKPAGPACTPGTPGCALPSAPSGPSGCTSGKCDDFPPIGGQGDFPSFKPSYSQGSSSYFLKPSGPGCALGAPGCAVAPSLSSPSGCASGNCGAYPLHQGCAPGTPGCSGSASPYGTLSLPSGHTSTGNSAAGYGASGVGSSSHEAVYGIHGTGSLQTSFNKPSTGFPSGISGSGAYTPGYPSKPSASSSAPGIGSTPQLGIVSASAGASGQDGTKENLPAYTGGFGGPDGILKPNEYSTAPASSLGNKPVVATVPTKHPSIPFASSSTSGIGSSLHLGIVGTTAGASGQDGAKENLPAYTGGFGGPDGILKPNEYSTAPASSLGNKPVVSTGPTKYPSIPFASSSPTSGIGSSLHLGFVGTTAGASGQDGAKENLPAYTGGFGGPDGIFKPNEHSSAPASSLGHKSIVSTSTTTYPSVPFASSSASGIGSSSHVGIVGTTAGASSQDGPKENLPAYTGGFGGPDGIFKPNEYNTASAASLDNKPVVSTGSTSVKPSCVSGTCGAQTSPSHAHSGTASGALTTVGASASANAVAYTGGFGGPPGLLKPYDGKADIKGAAGLGSSLHLHQVVHGSGYLTAGSQIGGSAVAQANAAAASSAGTSSGDNKFISGNIGGYSHGHGHDGGCGGGCGGTGSLGYSGSLGLSKAGVLDESSYGLAAAGAVAKSIGNASSGARAFGGSYASSSATAHAGAAVKGGYGRR